MALVHEQLYQSQDLARIELSSYIHDLTSHLANTYQSAGISLTIEADNISLAIDTAIPLGLIINELVSNAYKHAFPNGQGGTIAVILRSGNDGHYVLTVQDDGVGIPETMDFRTTDSLGLQLVDGLTRQLKGTIQSQQDKGTAFVIEFASEDG